jgi:hypothetical protein
MASIHRHQSRLSAELLTMRIIRSDDRYPPTAQPSIEKIAQVGTWSLSVRFGPISDDTTKLIGLYEVGRNLVLDYLFGKAPSPGQTPLQHFENRDREIDQAVSEYTLGSDWADPASLYITITARRAISVPTDAIPSEPRHFWIPEPIAKDLLKEHEADAEATIGFAVARSMIGPPYRHTGPTHPGCPQFLVVSEGREPSPLVIIRGSATATVTRAGWDDTMTGFQENSFALSESVSKDIYRAIGKLGQWYLKAYNETDEFRCFMWSYIGLEILVSAVANSGRDDLSSTLANASELGTETITELLWPADVRGGDPNRSVRFRFALSAAVLSPTSAADDVEKFLELNKYRNTIHGRMLPTVRPPTAEAFHLFDRYCVLAAAYLAGDRG